MSVLVYTASAGSTPRKSIPAMLSTALALLLAAGTAMACNQYTAKPDIVLDTVYTSWPSGPNVFMEEQAGRVSYEKCALPGGFVSVFVRLEVPRLNYVGDIQYDGRTYASYATGVDSALLAFDVYTNVYDRKPLRLGEDLELPYETSPGYGVQSTISHRALVFSRGGRMRTSLVRTGHISLRSPGHPELDVTSPYYLAPQFPAVTCPLQDVSMSLKDVQMAELAAPGATANEKPLAVRMDCGTDAPRATMTLTDAGDATNSGSLLTPTADSDARGVQVQLLQAGTEVQFGRIQDFEPGAGGTHDIGFTARYIRTDEPLVPGVIKGEAVLNVDYW